MQKLLTVFEGAWYNGFKKEMEGMKMTKGKKTRVAYGYHRERGELFVLGDTVEAALKANMMVKDYENALIKANPQLKITIKIK